MIRRRFLAGSGATFPTVLAGCLDAGTDTSTEASADETESPTTDAAADDPSADDYDFVRCRERIIPYFILPDDVKDEVDRAFDEDVSGSDDELLFPQAVGTNAALQKDGAYYDWDVDEDDAGVRLRFEETTPTRRRTNTLEVVNEMDEPVVVSVVVRDEAGETVVDETDVEVEPDDDISDADRPELRLSPTYESFDIAVTIDGDREETTTWDVISGSEYEPPLRLTDEEVSADDRIIEHHPCEQEYHG